MTALAMQRLVAVHLHGPLAQRFGRVHHLAVDSAAEAVRALSVLCKGFAEAARDWHGAGYRVRVGERDHARWCDEHTLSMGLGQAQRIDIVPSVSGRKRNGVGQVIVGFVIYIVGLVATAYGYGGVGVPMMQAGAAMMFGGVIALLTPMPKGSDTKSKEETSRALDGPPNIASSGGPVPLIIGRMMVGSVTISAGLSTDDSPIATVDPGPAAIPDGETYNPSEGPGGADSGTGPGPGDGPGDGDGGSGGDGDGGGP